MDISSVDQSHRQLWDDYVMNHPQGFAYHLYAWREAVTNAYGFRGIYLMARIGAAVCGVLPLIEIAIPLVGRKLVSLPYCDAGGVLADDPSIAAALLLAGQRVAIKAGAHSLELRHVDLQDGGADASVSAADAKVLMRLDLPATCAQLLAGFSAKLRSQINKPVRDGLRCRLGGVELIADFYPVFARNMRDLGSPVHSFEWIRQVVTAFADRARVGLVTLADGTAAAAGIILFTGRTVSIPWASSLREWNHLNPNMLLYRTFLEFAVDHGFRTFDFGRSTPGEGTFRFKAQWGARPTRLLCQELTAGRPNRTPKTVARLGRRAAAALWSRFPLKASNYLGPKLRRFISL